MKNDPSVKVLFSEEQIAARIKEVAAQIAKDYNGEPVLMVGILKGSVTFLADLMRALDLDIEIDFMVVSSYGSATKTSGVVQIRKDLDVAIEGRNVLIVEDIIDSGLTLSYLVQNLRQRNPKSVKVVTMLDKPARRKVDFKGNYVGFEVDDLYIVGYGLDADQKYRDLPYIGWIEV